MARELAPARLRSRRKTCQYVESETGGECFALQREQAPSPQGYSNPGDLHFTDDGCALNPQNATIPAIIDDGVTSTVAKAIVPIRLGLLTLCECALCYWAAEMPLGRR